MLIRTSRLEHIASELSKMPPDLNYIESKLKDFTGYFKGFGRICGLAGELAISKNLDDLSKEYDYIKLHPVKDYALTEHFFFRNSQDNVHVFKRNHPIKDYCEIDNLVEIDHIPVVLEVKLTDRWEDNDNPFKNSLKNTFGEYRIRQLTKPLQELFRDDHFGYIVVAYPEVVRCMTDHIIGAKRFMRKFVNKRGLISPFYMDRKNFMDSVKEIVKLAYNP